MKALILLILPLIFLAGCKSDGINVATTQEYQDQPSVKKIVTVDGITLYRILDGGEYVYFSGHGASWSETHSCGKHCIRTEHKQVSESEEER